jgi:hypothetical protein
LQREHLALRTEAAARPTNNSLTGLSDAAIEKLRGSRGTAFLFAGMKLDSSAAHL